VGFWQKLPCHVAGWPYDRDLIFGQRCYSDLPVLFNDRGLAAGHFPYATERSFEYPVITGYVADLTARMSSSGSAFFLINLVFLLLCTLVTVWATVQYTGRMWAGLIVALSPVLMVTGTINWDMLPVMLVALAMLAWQRERHVLAGLAIGLGAAAKLYPAFLLLAVFLVALKDKQLRGALITAVTAAWAWLLVNIPVIWLFPHGWLEFWRLNAERPADFGSVWYALDLVGVKVDNLNTVAILLFGLSVLAIAAFAPRRLETIALLTIAAFLITNKVYSPQYVLWLLPLVVMAGAPLFMIVIWQGAEYGYWWAVWGHLQGTLTYEQYATFTFVRAGALILLCAVTLMNGQLLPGDPVRRGRGVLQEEPDRDVPVAGGVQFGDSR
jgi:hypothetical protein